MPPTNVALRDLVEYDPKLVKLVRERHGHLWFARHDAQARETVAKYVVEHPGSPAAVLLRGGRPSTYRGVPLPSEAPDEPASLDIWAQARVGASRETLVMYGPFVRDSGHFRVAAMGVFRRRRITGEMLNRLATLHAERAASGEWQDWAALARLPPPSS